MGSCYNLKRITREWRKAWCSTWSLELVKGRNLTKLTPHRIWERYWDSKSVFWWQQQKRRTLWSTKCARENLWLFHLATNMRMAFSSNTQKCNGVSMESNISQNGKCYHNVCQLFILDCIENNWVIMQKMHISNIVVDDPCSQGENISSKWLSSQGFVV